LISPLNEYLAAVNRIFAIAKVVEDAVKECIWRTNYLSWLAGYDALRCL